MPLLRLSLKVVYETFRFVIKEPEAEPLSAYQPWFRLSLNSEFVIVTLSALAGEASFRPVPFVVELSSR